MTTVRNLAYVLQIQRRQTLYICNKFFPKRKWWWWWWW